MNLRELGQKMWGQMLAYFQIALGRANARQPQGPSSLHIVFLKKVWLQKGLAFELSASHA
jgi:hypothetical protein